MIVIHSPMITVITVRIMTREKFDNWDVMCYTTNNGGEFMGVEGK